MTDFQQCLAMTIVLIISGAWLFGVYEGNIEERKIWRAEIRECLNAAENIQLKQCIKMNNWSVKDD